MKNPISPIKNRHSDDGDQNFFYHVHSVNSLICFVEAQDTGEGRENTLSILMNGGSVGRIPGDRWTCFHGRGSISMK